MAHNNINWQLAHRTGLTFETIDDQSPIPTTAAEIIKFYKQASSNMIGEIKSKWSNGTLLKEDDMYGEMWTKEKALKDLVTHQIYHRSQLTILMRLLGLKVPGIYGPSNEECAAYGNASARGIKVV